MSIAHIFNCMDPAPVSFRNSLNITAPSSDIFDESKLKLKLNKQRTSKTLHILYSKCKMQSAKCKKKNKKKK